MGQIFMGIDPGSRYTGYGVIRVQGEQTQRLVSGRIATKQEEGLPDKLLFIHQRLEALLQEYAPQGCAVEQVFHAINPRSSLVLGQVRGAVLLTCARQGVPVFEYAPTAVKRAVVGTGRADKQQVAFMVKILLSAQGCELAEDEADALAIALCHAQHFAHQRALCTNAQRTAL